MALRSDWSLKQADKVFLDRQSRFPLLPALRLPEAVTACRCVCVWLGVVAVVWGLSTFVCVCTYVFVLAHLCVCGFKCLVLEVCLRVNLQPRELVQGLVFQTDCEDYF